MAENENVSIPIGDFYEEYYLPSMNMDRDILDALYVLNLQAHTNGDDHVVLERWLYDMIIENKKIIDSL